MAGTTRYCGEKGINSKEVNGKDKTFIIEKDESLLSSDTVRNHMSTCLASRHFRNELYLYRENYEEFKNIAQTT